jgi:hypothetical protein
MLETEEKETAKIISFPKCLNTDIIFDLHISHHRNYYPQLEMQT